MRNRSQLAASVACLAVIFGGIRYAVAREHAHDTDLHAAYQQINREYFAAGWKTLEFNGAA